MLQLFVMSTFAYTIRENTGRSSRGTLEAANASAAAAALRERGAVILRLTPAAQGTGSSRSVGTQSSGLTLPFSGPRSASIEVALKQMAVMLRSGLTLLETLKAVGEQTTSRATRQVFADVATDVRSGKTFTAAMKDRGCFSRIVLQLSEVGEQTGQLDVVLERAADALERRRLLASQVISALLYPLIVFLMALGVTIFMMTYAIPKIALYLRAMGRPLPPMAQFLVDISDFMMAQWPMILGFTLLAGILFGIAYSVPAGRLAIDTIVLRIPLIGYIFRTGATAAMSRTIALLLNSGVTIIESLRTCQDLHLNRRLALTIARSRENVMNGEALAHGFEGKGAFMPMLSGMIAAGERSGQLDQSLVECAKFHEQRLSSLIRSLSSVIEVVVIVFVGGIVGFVYIAFLLAMYGAAL